MQLGASDATVHAVEVHTRPARPHLANTGMEDYFDPDDDPLLGRGTAVVLGTGDIQPKNVPNTITWCAMKPKLDIAIAFPSVV